MPDQILPRRNGTGGREGAKQSFLAAMSHELRTPLNAIIGFAEIMDAQVLGPIEVPQYRQYIRDILGSGRHLLRIIEGVLDISNAETGELVLNEARDRTRRSGRTRRCARVTTRWQRAKSKSTSKCPTMLIVQVILIRSAAPCRLDFQRGRNSARTARRSESRAPSTTNW